MIRLWLSKESRTPIREQLSAQLLLGVLSGKLAAGSKLPSVRDLSRRLRIHRNTVAAVYQDLAQRGWVEVRQGSGVYVAPGHDGLGGKGIDAFVRVWLEQAHRQGYTKDDIRAALERMSELPARRWLVVSEEAAFAQILAAEIAEALQQRVDWAGLEGLEPQLLGDCFVLVNEGSVKAVRRALDGVELHCIATKSVAELVEGIQRPANPVLIGLVSRSKFILHWAATLLSALGFGEESVLLRDPSEAGWADGLKLCGIVAADIVAANDLPAPGTHVIVYRLISAASLDQLREHVTVREVS